ncbi:MAR-binding filament-like protein 1 [Brassica napus]|uniref:MAR-binding filament-like protein 1 n=1 Tax=Brassica napus TaxID=3708 RepID=UPI0020786B53|nr:MAR-binding filament-like protein 1 [Brassica napus]
MELCGSGINKEHQMCSKTFGYERIKDLSENVFRLKKISRWRLMWRKIMMGMKHKKKDQVLDHCFRYDPFTYSQNFENDGTIAYHEDPDVSSNCGRMFLLVSVLSEVSHLFDPMESYGYLSELNTRISTLEGEEKSYTQKLDDVSKDYSALKLTSETQAAANAEVISRKEEEIQQMKEKLDHVLKNVNERTKRTTVQVSRDSVSDLEKLLGESRALCSKFEPEVSVIRGEFDEAKERYEEKLAEERRNSEVLAKELAVEKDLLKKARDELEVEEAVKSLDEMNKNTSILTKELEKMNTHVSSLEDEKEVLQRTLEEANKASKEAKENMEGAYSFLMSLRKERGVIEKKVKKLEEDLGSAKGEILRMRSQSKSVKAVNSTEDEEKSDDKVTAKKVVRRRKSSTSS